MKVNDWKPALSARGRRLCLWRGGAAFALLIFERITRELIEGDVNAADGAILLDVVKMRPPWLTAAAVDVTALGSVTVVVLFSLFTLLVLLVLRDRVGALQLLVASAGAGALTVATKDMIDRLRPAEVPPLITVSGVSYPRGHSVATSAVYLTIAIIASRCIKGTGANTAIFLAVSVLIIMVGASRVYLGVHYATDVLSGFSLGTAWALLLAGLFTRRASQSTSA